MTTDTDKLVEMARAAGFTVYNGTIYCHDSNVTQRLAAFASAHITSLCGDVEPVAWGIFANNGNIRFWACDKASADSQAAKTGGDVEGIFRASTVATLKARVAELEKDAARYRWLRQEHERFDPICHLTWKAGGNRNSSEWVNTAVLDSSIDAALTKGQQ